MTVDFGSWGEGDDDDSECVCVYTHMKDLTGVEEI